MPLDVNEVNLLETSLLSPEFKQQVFELWNHEYPVDIKQGTLEDMLHYMDGLEGLRHGLILDDTGRCQAWFATYLKDGEHRFIIVVSSAVHGKGYGSFIMEHLKKGLDSLYGWVIDEDRYKKENGQTYRSPLEFYIKQGFEVLEERLERQLISAVKVKWERS